jgi:hypothetical protein
MIGNLDEAIEALLVGALPGLLGGVTPAVSLSVDSGQFVVDSQSAETPITDPRPDDHSDNFPFDPAHPPAFFTLTQPPYPGPRRVRLTTSLGDRIALQESEVQWDETDPRVFRLALRPTHDLTGVSGVQALYGVIAVFINLKANHTFNLQLQSSNAAQLEQAESLALGVLELNRQALIDGSLADYEDGDYSATVKVKSFKFLQGASPAANQRLFTFQAEVELKARRALEAGEGKPIVTIRTSGRPLDPNRPVDIQIDIQA